MGDEKNKPTMRDRLKKVGRFAYNKERKTFCGRTCLSWLLIFLFYIVFYVVLAGFFIGMLCVLLYGVVNDSEPNLTGAQSLLRMVPSIDYKPRTEFDTTFINYIYPIATSTKDTDRGYLKYSNKVVEFYSSHSSVNASLNSAAMEYVNCSLSDAQANRGLDPSKQICRQNPATDWGNCTMDNQFGYSTPQPCVIIKMNRMYGWIPTIDNTSRLNHTMLLCEGENDGDKVNLGKVEYYPGVSVNGVNYGYFSSALFPFLNQPGYTSASVAVRFVGVRHNVVVMVLCSLTNVKGIMIDKPNRIGVTHFELLIKSPSAKA